MMYPLVRELAADGIPVAVTCRVLKIARQPYYRWLADPITAAELDEAYRAAARPVTTSLVVLFTAIVGRNFDRESSCGP